jgi:hypothetical protein
MDHIEQLKTIRADAIQRLRRSADFKLAKKLGILLLDLGEKADDRLEFEPSEEQRKSYVSLATPAPNKDATIAAKETRLEKPKADSSPELSNEEVIDELVAEMENDTSIIKDASVDSKGGLLGPFLKPVASNGSAANH